VSCVLRIVIRPIIKAEDYAESYGPAQSGETELSGSRFVQVVRENKYHNDAVTLFWPVGIKILIAKCHTDKSHNFLFLWTLFKFTIASLCRKEKFELSETNHSKIVFSRMTMSKFNCNAIISTLSRRNTLFTSQFDVQRRKRYDTCVSGKRKRKKKQAARKGRESETDPRRAGRASVRASSRCVGT
jgi:hypothetical protein